MKHRLIRLLRCRACGSGDLHLEVRDATADEVITGTVRCNACGATIHVSGGILRAVDGDKYAGSFSFEWQLHRRTQLDTDTRDNSARVFHRKTGLASSDLKDAHVLDVGVGTGRFADVVSRAGADVVGVDLSYAVETAMENLGSRDNVNIVQANLFDLPFKPESFDIIYSIGVLHHTPDCRAAFRSLVPYLRPGGTIVIWVYDAHNWPPGSLKDRVNTFWRMLTTRLPHRLLYGCCILELPFYFLRRIPGLDQFLHLVLPGAVYHAIPTTNRHKRVKEHLLDTFDWYSPRFQSKHTYPEVFSWFECAGLENVRVLPVPVAVSGRKPAIGMRPNAVHDDRVAMPAFVDATV